MAFLRTTPQRILDFDCENRPLSYKGNDFTTPELTVVAWKSIVPRGDLLVAALGFQDMAEILDSFLEVYAQADVVTGHNIIKHDLRLINAMLLEQGRPPLHPKMVCDTYWHLKKRAPGFASQADLADYLGVRAPKVGMSTKSWRESNRLVPDGIDRAVGRAVGDVRQHIQLRKRLLDLDWLRPPKMWTP